MVVQPQDPTLTVSSEHVNVQLLEEVHDERVDLRQQAQEEDDGETQKKDCRETRGDTLTWTSLKPQPVTGHASDTAAGERVLGFILLTCLVSKPDETKARGH